MIWRRKDSAENHFPTFHHQEARIEALETDMLALSKELLSYFGDGEWGDSDKSRLVDTLQTIVNRRVGLSEK